MFLAPNGLWTQKVSGLVEQVFKKGNDRRMSCYPGLFCCSEAAIMRGVFLKAVLLLADVTV